jgi:hypothetical protein
MAGLLAALLVWTAVRRLGTPLPVAVVVVGAFSLSPPLAVYATQLYPELPAALLATAAIALVTGPLRPQARWALAASLIALPWLSVQYVPLAATLAGIALARLCKRADHRPAIRLVVVLAVAAAAYLVLHQRLYGGWTPYAAGGQFTTGEFGVMGDDPDYGARSGRLLDALVDTRFGLAAWQPAWLLAVPALAALLRRRPPGMGRGGPAAGRRLADRGVPGRAHARLVVAGPPHPGRPARRRPGHRLVGRHPQATTGNPAVDRDGRGRRLRLAAGRGGRRTPHLGGRLLAHQLPALLALAAGLPRLQTPASAPGSSGPAGSPSWPPWPSAAGDPHRQRPRPQLGSHKPTAAPKPDLGEVAPDVPWQVHSGSAYQRPRGRGDDTLFEV